MRQRHPLIIAAVLTLTGMQLAWAAKPLHLEQVGVETQLKQQQIQFKQKSRHVDFNQVTHVRLQQTYAGYPVYGADIVLHEAKNKRNSMNGIVYQGLREDLISTPHYALVNSQKDKVLQFATQEYQKKSGVKLPVKNQQAKLMVFVDKKQQAHWVYWVRFDAETNTAMPAQPTFIIDAQTLEIYKEWNNIQTIDNVIGGGYGGNLNIGRLVYDGAVGDLAPLDMQRAKKNPVCYLKNNEVMVKDVRTKGSTVQIPCAEKDPTHNNVYWDASFDKINGGYSPSNDALFLGKVISNMYHDWYSVPPLVLNGQPMVLKMRVHADMENAYWDGKSMTFGDGGADFYPFTSLGIGAHEISHGFTEQHSNLEYEGQSGGLNESFSDMAAQAAEFYAYGHNSWLIGPEIFKEKGQSLRYMDVPSKDCNGGKPGNDCSIDNVNQYKDDIDVHYTSGVFNRFFYLLGTAPNWNVRKAFDVMVKANQDYWTSTTSFADAACGVMHAAKDYNYDTTTVQKAAADVGIDVGKC